MEICAVITEYNPFHNGHMKQIEYIKQNLPDAVIVAIMSGNMVQRGEPAILDKHTRAKTAVMCGADAVLELPYPWCASSAGYFAEAGASIAHRLGADHLCFGSESGDIEELIACAERLNSAEYNELLKKRCEDEKSTSKSYIELSRYAYHTLYETEMPDGPNNTLALEYIKTLLQLKSSVKPMTHKRMGNFSATKTRQLYRDADPALKNNVPPAAYEIYKENHPTDISSLGSILLWHLRSISPNELCKYADIDMGLASRMIRSAHESRDIEELYKNLATKKYTDSRIRRGALNSILKVTEDRLRQGPSFTSLLAANPWGCKAVKEMCQRGDLPIITKPADHTKAGEQASENFLFSSLSDTLFATLRKTDSSSVLRNSPVIFKD